MKDIHDKSSIFKNRNLWIAFSTLMLVLIILFGTYYLFAQKANNGYVSLLIQQKNKIDAANKSAAKALKNIGSLDTEDQDKLKSIISKVSDSESLITNAYNALLKISPSAKYKTQYNNYVKAVILNKKIFTQTNLILKNTKSKDLKKATDALYEYVAEAANSYEAARLGKSYIMLPTDIIALPDNVAAYANKAYEQYVSNTILLEQYNTYYASMDEVNSKFQNVMTDLNLNLEKIKNGNASLEQIYILIEDKFSQLNDISDKYNSINVPSNIAKDHQSFNDILNSYTNYCQDFKTSLTQFEEAGDNALKLDEVNTNFTNLEKVYKTIYDSYSNFTETYEKNKSTYTNIENL